MIYDITRCHPSRSTLTGVSGSFDSPVSFSGLLDQKVFLCKSSLNPCLRHRRRSVLPPRGGYWRSGSRRLGTTSPPSLPYPPCWLHVVVVPTDLGSRAKYHLWMSVCSFSHNGRCPRMRGYVVSPVPRYVQGVSSETVLRHELMLPCRDLSLQSPTEGLPSRKATQSFLQSLFVLRTLVVMYTPCLEPHVPVSLFSPTMYVARIIYCGYGEDPPLKW